MSFSIGVLMDPIESINPKKDSTLAMMLAAQKQGWTVSVFSQADLYIENGEVLIRRREVELFDNLDHWFQEIKTTSGPASEFDAILMRKDPPFDMEYIYSTYLLEIIEDSGTPVLNRPGSIRDCNEKLFALRFPQCTPPHLVSRDPQNLRAFHEIHGDVIYKPLDGMGGTSIFRAKEGEQNLSVIIETLTQYGQVQTMAQRYIPEILDGDTRILLINGEPVPYGLARVPSKGETRGNLAAGGTAVGRALTERDLFICKEVGPVLKEKGLYFVGIDVIGDYLTEINVTCPTCVRELDAAFGLDIAGDYMRFIESEIINPA
ncbi:MAG: glutathione synthase [Pseudomonadales bacterium]|nr:glutathione synthase [Pseudomonadales bacterium]MBO6596704.1 glutathione synthase [Pseudomonadales bacterium]MBO6656005.1 glutathione synthase [Pseudomonadales bacterium]MBO6703375.1 glutathione synthase [Pseudomonadales bacterium]MBO6823307.1 glutathione synthase [Pseudomonadales bacterium]